MTELLDRYVQPTVAQWIEIENAHEGYLERFAQLRETEIARFLTYMQENMDAVPDSRTTKEFLRRVEQLRKKIRTQDDQLINEIAQHLNDEQLAGLERVRRIRERTRLVSGYATVDSADRDIEIWTLLQRWEKNIPPEVLDRVDVELANYEQRVIPLLKAWRAAQEKMMLILVEEIQTIGLDDLSLEHSTQEEFDRAADAFQLAFANAQLATQKAVDAMVALNERTVKALESLAGEAHGRPLRMAYYSRISNGSVLRDPGNLERITWRLLQLEDLPEETRELVLATQRSYRDLDDAQVSRLLAAAMELQAFERSVGVSDSPDETNALREAIKGHTASRRDLAERMRSALRVQLEPLGDSRLLAIVDSGGARVSDETQEVAWSEDLPAGDPGRGGPSDFVQSAISRRDIEAIAVSLDPEPWQQAILSTIYDDYLAMWEVEVEPIAVACRRAQASIYRVDPKTQQTFMDADALRKSYALAREATLKSAEVDAVFFSNLSAPVSDSQRGALERLRYARSMDLYLRGTDPVFNPSGLQFQSPNIFEHIDDLDLSEDQEEKLDVFLRERSGPLIAAARAARDVRYDTELRIHELNQRMSSKLASGAIGSTEYGTAYRKLLAEMVERYGEQIREWNTARQTFLDDLVAELPSEHAPVFIRTWKRASNPTVYRDAGSASQPIRQGLELSDLTPDQVGAIATVMAEYEVDWEKLSDEMATVREAMKKFGALSAPDEYGEYQKFEQRYKQLEFQRNELNERALRRLALYLSPEQRLKIRALRRLEE